MHAWTVSTFIPCESLHQATLCLRTPPASSLYLRCSHMLQARVYVNPEDILKGEVDENLSKVREAAGILCFFKQIFEEKRENLRSYYKEDETVREWDFNSLLIFARMNCHLKRLEQIEVR